MRSTIAILCVLVLVAFLSLTPEQAEAGKKGDTIVVGGGCGGMVVKQGKKKNLIVVSPCKKKKYQEHYPIYPEHGYEHGYGHGYEDTHYAEPEHKFGGEYDAETKNNAHFSDPEPKVDDHQEDLGGDKLNDHHDGGGEKYEDQTTTHDAAY